MAETFAGEVRGRVVVFEGSPPPLPEETKVRIERAVATVATLHRIRRRAQQPLIQKHQRLLQPRRQQLLKHLPQPAEPP